MNSKRIKLAAGIVILIMAGTGVAIAQQSGNQTHAEAPAHTHKGDHGGQVQVAGDYHIELVNERYNYKIYLTDAREREVNLKGINGMAIFRDGDQTTGTYPLGPSGNAHFILPIPKKPHTAVIIKFQIKDQSIIAKFDNDTREAQK
jgi:hypothetical protein